MAEQQDKLQKAGTLGGQINAQYEQLKAKVDALGGIRELEKCVRYEKEAKEVEKLRADNQRLRQENERFEAAARKAEGDQQVAEQQLADERREVTSRKERVAELEAMMQGQIDRIAKLKEQVGVLTESETACKDREQDLARERAELKAEIVKFEKQEHELVELQSLRRTTKEQKEQIAQLAGLLEQQRTRIEQRVSKLSKRDIEARAKVYAMAKSADDISESIERITDMTRKMIAQIQEGTGGGAGAGTGAGQAAEAGGTQGAAGEAVEVKTNTTTAEAAEGEGEEEQAAGFAEPVDGQGDEPIQPPNDV